MRPTSRCAAVLLFLLLAACTPTPERDRVVVLGLDGMDPDTVDLLVSEGTLPNFARLRRHGAFGRLLSSRPILSPIIWTTIATGKAPNEHGIGHFTAVNQKTGEQLPVTSQMRRVQAVWNILSAHERSVAVVGWWATWPAEHVNGSIVSDHTCYHFLFDEGATGDHTAVGVTHPPQLRDALAPLVRRPGDLTAADVADFVDVAPEELDRAFRFDDDLSHFKWALATANTYERIGLHLWERDRPDVLMVYIEGVDSSSHLFGHLFRAGPLAGELAAQQRQFGGTVEAMYQYADALVGRYLDVIDARTTLIVLSDHGFQLGVLPNDPSKLRDMRRVSERFHDLEGILYLYGNHVRPGATIEQPTLLDVAPTLLALQGISPATDMPGRVLAEALDFEPPARSLASFETGTATAAASGADARVDPAILDHLRALGYLDVASTRSDRNLAAIHFEKGEYAASARAYAALVEESPQDGSLRASLAGALGALGRHDEALAQLDQALQLAPLNPEARYNRGVIFERQGKPAAAIDEYRALLRYTPDYQPARDALVRLTGSAAAEPAPANDAERRALRLCKGAGEAARRGDYGEAWTLLDEAASIAPGLAQVHQYRSNVAYLRGDRPAAIAALERALEIEPDNALFRQNLERLRATP